MRYIPLLRSLLTGDPPNPRKFGHTTGVYVPYLLFWNSGAGFCCVSEEPDNWKCCKTGPTVFRPYPRRLESNRFQIWLRGQLFLLSYLKTLSFVPARVWSSLRHVLVFLTGTFRQLHSLVQESNNSLSYFMHVFTQNGTFVFYDNAEPFREMIVTVKEQGSSCPGSILSPTTENVLVELGVSNKEVRT